MSSGLDNRADTDVPSIKGSVLGGHAEVFKKYVQETELDPQVLKDRFEPGDLKLLNGWIHPGTWYDIRIYARVLAFLRDYPGEGRNEYLIEAGRRSADNMIRSGVHSQFAHLRKTELVGETDPQLRFEAFGRDLRLLLTVGREIVNFAYNHLIVDPDHSNRYIIEHVDAEAYPEVQCWTTQGFCNRMAEEHDTPDLWYWERPSRDKVWYRMNRAV